MWGLFCFFLIVVGLCNSIGGGNGMTDAEIAKERERMAKQNRGLVGPWYKPKK